MSSLAKKLLRWFDQHGRKDLPWQKNKTPYSVWISEIMLQQTQVKTVIPYYQRFMERFPDIRSLANASLDEVLSYWAGLGYYARARNMHKAAQIIATEYAGVFPNELEEVMKLPGIGRSTAGAILSLALKQRHVILDGNVKRVLTRLYGIEGWPDQPAVLRELWSKAEQMTPKQRSDDYNQAIMDLGATVCIRGKNAQCDLCPFKTECVAYQKELVALLPTPKPKKVIPVKKTRMLMICDKNNRVLLEKRPPVGIWGGLWSFPECDDKQNLRDWCEQKLRVKVKELDEWQQLRHTFSHFHLDITPVRVMVGNPKNFVMEEKASVWYKLGQQKQTGCSKPVQELLKKLETEIGVYDESYG